MIRVALAAALALVLVPAHASADEIDDAYAACMVDAVCGWDFVFAHQQRSAIRIGWTENGVSHAGSAVLLNTEGQAPIIMTSAHVFDPDLDGTIDPEDEARVGSVSTLYEFSEGTNCGDIYDVWGSTGMGATILDANYDADLMLIRLGINLARDWIYYAGWKVDADADAVFAVSYPWGWPKQYALSGDFVDLDEDGIFVSGWAEGLVLPGSSGGPVFDAADGLVIGAISSIGPIPFEGCNFVEETWASRFDIAYYEGFWEHLGLHDEFPGGLGNDHPLPEGLPAELQPGDNIVITFQSEFFIESAFFAPSGSSLHIYKGL